MIDAETFREVCHLTVSDQLCCIRLLERAYPDGTDEIALSWDEFSSGPGELRFNREDARKIANAILGIPNPA